jgi:hypothetical protein
VTRRGDQEQQRRRQQEQQRQQHAYAALWQRGFAPAAAMKPEFRAGRFCTYLGTIILYLWVTYMNMAFT